MTFKTDEVNVTIGFRNKGNNARALLLGKTEDECFQEYQRELVGLETLLRQNNVQVARIPHLAWARDIYAFWNEQFYVTLDLYLKDERHPLTEGGALLFGKDYILVSDALPESLNINKEETAKKVCDLYKLQETIFVPSPKEKDHIDMDLLLLPSINALLANEEYYEEHREELSEIAKRKKLSLIQIPMAYASLPEIPHIQVYPANSLEIENKTGELLIFTAKPDGASPLHQALDEYRNVRIIEVPFTLHCASNGSIRCRTNFAP